MRVCPAPGPFWGTGDRKGHSQISHGRSRGQTPLTREWRVVERAPWAKGAKSCRQLSGAGSVGGQVLTGLPALWRLRRELGAAVWPFDTGLEPPDAPLVLAEVYPSLLAAAVRAEAGDEIVDRVQVRVLARALAALDAGGAAGCAVRGGAGARGGGAGGRWHGRRRGSLGAGHAAELAAAAAPRLRDDCFALPPGVDWVPVEAALARLASGGGAGRGDRDGGARRRRGDGSRGRRDGAAGEFRRRRTRRWTGTGSAHGSLGAGPHVLTLVEGRAAGGGAVRGGGAGGGGGADPDSGRCCRTGWTRWCSKRTWRRTAGRSRFARGPKPRANTRAAGEDVAAGTAILAAGRRLGAQDLALAAATGLAEVAVRRALRVAVLSTGDEIRGAGDAAAAHQTFDANRPMLLEILRRWQMQRGGPRAGGRRRGGGGGGAGPRRGRGGRDPDHGRGVGGGRGPRFGAAPPRGGLATWRIAVKPGRPLALGTWQGVPVFGLPGNPVAAFVCTLIFARPALLRLAGAPWEAPAGLRLPAAFAKEKRARAAGVPAGAARRGRGGSRSSAPRGRGGSPGWPGRAGWWNWRTGRARSGRAIRCATCPSPSSGCSGGAEQPAEPPCPAHRRGLRHALHGHRRAGALLAAVAGRLGAHAGGGRRSTPRSASRCGWWPGWRSRRSPTGSTGGRDAGAARR